MAVAAISFTSCSKDKNENGQGSEDSDIKVMSCVFAISPVFLDYYSVAMEYALPNEEKQIQEASWEDVDGLKMFKFCKEVTGTGKATMQMLFTRNEQPVDTTHNYDISIGQVYSMGKFKSYEEAAQSLSLSNDAITVSIGIHGDKMENYMLRRVNEYGRLQEFDFK